MVIGIYITFVWQRGLQDGRQEGYAEAEQKHEMLVAARTMKNAGVSLEITASAYPLSEDEISNL